MWTIALKYWREVALVALVFFLMAACADRDRALVEKGKAQQAAKESAARAQQLDSMIVVAGEALRAYGDSLDVQVDTVQRVLTRLKVDTLVKLDTIYLAGDSTHTHPLVPLPASQVTDYRKLQTTCSDLTNSCRAFRDSAFAQFANYEKRLKEQPATIEIRTSCIQPTLFGTIAGAGAGYFVGRRSR